METITRTRIMNGESISLKKTATAIVSKGNVLGRERVGFTQPEKVILLGFSSALLGSST